MATPTANYGLVKAAPTENYDVAVVNANLDASDAAIKARADAITALTTRVTALETANTTLDFKPWTDVSSQVSIRTESGGSAAATTAIQTARAMKIGNLISFYGQGTVGATAVVAGAVMLPATFQGSALAFNRQLAFGALSANPQTAGAMSWTRMAAARDRFIYVSSGGGFLDFPANSTIAWFVQYEVS